MSSLIYCIADVHLEKDDRAKSDLFLSFVRMVKDTRGDLYILGDLFDYWANNRRVLRDFQVVLNALADLSSQGSKIGFLIGNRDLLLGERVLSRYGVDYLGESSRLELQGKRLLVTHGHLLLTNDVGFQRYRRTAWPIYRILDAVLPGWIENALAKCFMRTSKKVIEAQEPWRLQFPEKLIRKTLAEGVELIICGHTHCPLVRQYDGGRTFVVLPSWTAEKGGYLCLHEGHFTVHDFYAPQG